ncbi:MAG: TonB-dependent receptor, partial [Pseudomonadota bacterium]
GGSQSSSTSPSAVKGKGSYSNAIVDDLLAYRASFFVDKQDGDFKNVGPEGGTFQEKNRYGGRLQFLLKPTDSFTAKLNLDAAQSRELSNTKPFIEDPLTYANGHLRTDKYNAATNTWTANGDSTYTTRLARSYFNNYTPIIGSWDKIDIGQAKPLLTNNRGASLNLNWDVGPVSLTSISAYRRLNFDANNDSEQTRFDINRGGTLVNHEQYSQEFRIASNDAKVLEYQGGLFFMHNETQSTSRTLYGQDAGAFYATNAQYATLAANQAALKASLNNVSVTSLTTPETDSTALFGQVNWHLDDKATLTVGVRDTYEEKSSTYNKLATNYLDGSALTTTGNATADAIRTAQTKNLTGTKNGQDINENSIAWLINPTYKLNKDVMLYASAASGQKSGSVQFDSSGNPLNVDPEKSLDFELGIKSSWLNRKLFLNANLYRTDISDYQTTATVVSTTSPTGFATQLVNIGGVLLRGLEIDGGWSPTNRWNFNFGAAFNDAVYSDYKNGTCAVETQQNGFCDYTGRALANAPKVIVNLGVDYKQPVSDHLLGHAFFNNVYRSRTNLATTFSDYTWQDSYNVSNGGVGVVTRDEKYEFNLVAKNLFD